MKLLCKIAVLCLLLPLWALILTSCHKTEAGVETEKIYTNYRVEAMELNLGAEEYVLDADREDGGFRVLVGIPEKLHGTETTLYDGTPLTYHDGAEKRGDTSVVNSTIRHYDDTFSTEIKREATDVKYVRRFDRFDDGEYLYRAHLVSYIYPLMTQHLGRSRTVLRGSYYEMYRNGELLFAYFTPSHVDEYTVEDEEGNEIAKGSIPYKAGDSDPTPGEDTPVSMRDAQYWVKNGVIFAVTRVTGSADPFLFINERRIPAPGGGTIRGVAEIGGQVYALVEGEGRGIMIPVDVNTTQLDPARGTELTAAPTGTCGSDGKAAYFLAGGDLYRTDGENTCRIAETGFDEKTNVCRIRPLEDGRILMVADYRLYLLTPTEEATS